MHAEYVVVGVAASFDAFLKSTVEYLAVGVYIVEAYFGRLARNLY